MLVSKAGATSAEETDPLGLRLFLCLFEKEKRWRQSKAQMVLSGTIQHPCSTLANMREEARNLLVFICIDIRVASQALQEARL